MTGADDSTRDGPEPEGSAGLLTTGDMARLTESTLRTVRFYEEESLLRPISRSGNGHRLFERAQLQKLQLILDLRAAGLSLQDIKSLFALKSGCGSAEEASRRLSDLLETQIDEMQKKIATLRRLREELATTVSVLSECLDCERAEFPRPCQGCDVVNQPDVPRAVRLLWGD